MPVRQRRQVCVDRRGPGRVWLPDAYTGHRGAGAALVLRTADESSGSDRRGACRSKESDSTDQLDTGDDVDSTPVVGALESGEWQVPDHRRPKAWLSTRYSHRVSSVMRWFSRVGTGEPRSR